MQHKVDSDGKEEKSKLKIQKLPKLEQIIFSRELGHGYLLFTIFLLTSGTTNHFNVQFLSFFHVSRTHCFMKKRLGILNFFYSLKITENFADLNLAINM